MQKTSSLYLAIIIFISAMCLVPKSIAIQMSSLESSKVLNNENVQNVGSSYDCRYLKNLMRKKVTPENTIFAFDLHEVLFNRYRTKIMWGGVKLFCKSFLYMLFHPLFVFQLINVCCQPMVCEGMYVKLQEDYPYIKNWENDVFEISNGCCYPEFPMINLIKILKQKGFKIFLLSNIGADTLIDFRKRFDCIEGLFDGFYTPSRTNNYSYKPIRGFYEGFKKYVESFGYKNHQVIFIDDIERNISGAFQAGISGIHFLNYESLLGTLSKIGIILHQSNDAKIML